MVIHHCLPFADEQRSVKCLGSAAGVSFPSPPLPPLLLFCSFFAQCPRALAPLDLKETETTATQVTLQVYERVGISGVEVYERVGPFIIFPMEGIRRGYHLSMEGIRKGYLFCQK